MLNSLAGEALERGLSSLAAYGRFIELGKADIYQNQRVSLGPFRKNLSMFAVDLDWMCLERTTLVGTLLREVTGEFEAGRLRPPPCTEFPMTELPEALRFMAQAKHIGKVVVKNGQPIPVRRAIPEAPRVRRDGSYLITGGLGGARPSHGALAHRLRGGRGRPDGTLQPIARSRGHTCRTAAAGRLRRDGHR